MPKQLKGSKGGLYSDGDTTNVFVILLVSSCRCVGTQVDVVACTFAVHCRHICLRRDSQVLAA